VNETRFKMDQDTTDLEVACAKILIAIGENAKRGGLAETPTRFARAMRELTAGYDQDPAEVLKVFEDGAEGVDEMVCVRAIPFWSLCEHHLSPFFGTADVAYVPSGKVVGLSKLVRLVDVFARRLQVQERMTAQVADALDDHLRPLGVGVVVRARHLCMESRGILRPGCETVTSALRGVMREKGEARSEFLALAR